MTITIFTKKVLLASLFLFCTPLFSKQIYWDWSKINTTNISFPKKFLWGCSDSALQTEGMVSANGKMVPNSWTEFEKKLNLPAKVGVSCQRWKYFREDIERLKKTGMNTYRFSIEWSKVQPEENYFDDDAMQHYIDVVDCCLELGITPIVTLFHHTCPLWFMEKKGFETSKTRHYFVQYATHVFNRFHKKANMWIIFNEPVAYAMEAYYRGKYAPGKKSLSLTGKVIKNMLNAHVAVAQEFRKIDASAKIGIAHMMHPLDATSKWNPFPHMVGKWFSGLMNDTAIEFFKTGKFVWTPRWVRTYNKNARGSLDFFGVNYYTHTTIRQVHPFKIEAHTQKGEIVMDSSPDNPELTKVMYPEGLYRSIKKASKLRIPIYITENGSATRDPELKTEYLKRHLYVVSRCLKEGFDIRGYLLWTLTDCFSWHKGYRNRHGLYAVDFETQERTYRPHAQYLIDTLRKAQGLEPWSGE